MKALKIHNAVQYVLGTLFLASPFVFGFADVHFAQAVFTALGFFVIGASLLTNYPYSLIPALPRWIHQLFGLACGLFVVLAPWIYGYSDLISRFQHWVHWACAGSLLLSATLMPREQRVPPPSAARIPRRMPPPPRTRARTAA